MKSRIFKLFGLIFILLFSYQILDKSKEFFNVYFFILSLFLALFGNIIYNFGKRPNLLMIAAFLAVIQWLVGPMLAFYINYEFYASDEIVLFKVSELDYFRYTVPATVTFVLGLLILQPPSSVFNDLPKFLETNKSHAQQLGPNMFYLGVFTILISTLISLGYIAWLASGCLQVAVIVYWLFDLEKKIPVTILGFGFTFVTAFLHGMFGELVYWSLFMAIFISLKFRIDLFKKILFFTIAIFVVFVISATKWEYRILTWNNPDKYTSSQKLVLYKDIIVRNLSNNKIDRTRAAQEIVIRRLNQGGTISHIMKRVPKIEPYANGETILTAIATAIVPRLFWPNKPVAGMHDFYRFTGYRLKGTSMGLTPIGEAYANFGRIGGIITMFFYGIFISYIYRKLIINSFKQNKLWLIFIPIIFFRTIYAESDLMRTMTAAVKGLMFLYILILFYRKILNKNII